MEIFIRNEHLLSSSQLGNFGKVAETCRELDVVIGRKRFRRLPVLTDTKKDLFTRVADAARLTYDELAAGWIAEKRFLNRGDKLVNVHDVYK